MARYVIDLACTLRLLESNLDLPRDHEILAPTLLRSQVLDSLFRRALDGDMEEADALAVNTRFAKLKIRYLGDAVLRRRAWTVAKQLAMTSTFDAECIALTELQADALIAEDPQLASLAKQRVPLEPFQALT